MKYLYTFLFALSSLVSKAQVEPLLEPEYWSIEKVVIENDTTYADTNNNNEYEKLLINSPDTSNFGAIEFVIFFSNIEFDDANQSFEMLDAVWLFENPPEGITDAGELFMWSFAIEAAEQDAPVKNPFTYDFREEEDKIYLDITNSEGDVATFWATNTNYKSFFGTEETHIVRVNSNDILMEDAHSIDSISITEDIVIDNDLVLKRAEVFNVWNTDPIDTFYFREDLIDGKLWSRSSIDDSDEILLVDLSLEVGDEFISNSGQTHLVTEAYEENGDKIIKMDTDLWLSLNSVSEDFYFFKEGVIPIIIPDNQSLDGNYIFKHSIPTCIYKDEEEAFTIDEVWEVDFDAGSLLLAWLNCELFDFNDLSSKDFDFSQFTVYPNPVNDRLHLESPHEEIQKIEIFDMNGKRVLQSNFSNQAYIEVGRLARGVYMLRVDTKKGSATKKLVKE